MTNVLVPPPLMALTTLTADEAEHMARIFKTVRMAAGTVVFRESEPPPALYVIEDGRVGLLRHDDDGRARCVDYLVSGDFFGEMALIDVEALDVTARVEEDADLLFLPRSDFERLVRERPELAFKVLTFIARKLEGPDRLAAFEVPWSRSINRVVGFSASVAGQGNSFIAANVARALDREGETDETCPVVLLELDGPYGNADVHLRCSRGAGWATVIDEVGRGGDVDVFAAATKVSGGLSYLSSPRDASLVATLSPSILVRLVQILRDRARMVVIDFPPGAGPLVEAVSRLCDITFLVSTCCVDAVQRLLLHQRAMSRCPGFPRAHPIILNRHGGRHDVTLGSDDVAPCRIVARVPNVAAVMHDVDSQVWVDAHPRSSVSRVIRDLASRIVLDGREVSEKARFLHAWLPFHEPFSQDSDVTVSSVAHLRPLVRNQRGRARLALGEALLLAGRHFDAYRELRRAVEDDPSLVSAYATLARTADTLGRSSETTSWYQAALRYAPGDLRTMAGLALASKDRDLLARARSALASAVAEQPAWPDLRLDLGRVCAALGDFGQACLEIEEALRVNPSFGEAHRVMGDVLFEQGKRGLAIESYRVGLKCAPADVLGWTRLALVYRDVGLIGVAVEALEEAVHLCPHHEPAQVLLIELRGELAQVDDEIRTLDAARAMTPDFPDTLLALGRALFRRGAFEASERHVKRALRFNPDLVEAKEFLIHLGTLRERIGPEDLSSVSRERAQGIA